VFKFYLPSIGSKGCCSGTRRLQQVWRLRFKRFWSCSLGPYWGQAIMEGKFFTAHFLVFLHLILPCSGCRRCILNRFDLSRINDLKQIIQSWKPQSFAASLVHFAHQDSNCYILQFGTYNKCWSIFFMEDFVNPLEIQNMFIKVSSLLIYERFVWWMNNFTRYFFLIRYITMANIFI